MRLLYAIPPALVAYGCYWYLCYLFARGDAKGMGGGCYSNWYRR